MQRIVVPCRHHAPAARAPASHPSRPARDAIALHAQALRGKLGSVFDMLDARMPLAYMHIVHVLVDTLLYLAPLALYPKVGALAVPLSAKARQLAAAGDGPQPRAELAALLAAQLGALTATKMGAEVGPGVCTFAGAPPV